MVDADLLAGLTGLVTDGLSVFTTRGVQPGAVAWDALRDATEPVSTEPAAPRGAMFYTSGTTGRPKGIVRQPASPA